MGFVRLSGSRSARAVVKDTVSGERIEPTATLEDLPFRERCNKLVSDRWRPMNLSLGLAISSVAEGSISKVRGSRASGCENFLLNGVAGASRISSFRFWEMLSVVSTETYSSAEKLSFCAEQWLGRPTSHPLRRLFLIPLC